MGAGEGRSAGRTARFIVADAPMMVSGHILREH